MNQKTKRKGSGGILTLIGLCLLLTIGSALLGAKLILSGVLDQDSIPLCAAAIATMLAFVVGLFGSKKSCGKKFLWGILASAVLFLILLMGNLTFFGVRFRNIALIGGGVLVGGFIGSLLGKKKVRKYA